MVGSVEEVAGSVEKVVRSVEKMDERLCRELRELNKSMSGIADRLDALLEVMQPGKALPGAGFWHGLAVWLENHDEPRHVAITGVAPGQIAEVCASLAKCLPGVFVGGPELSGADLTGVLLNLENRVFIFARPDVWGSKTRSYLWGACAKGVLSILIEAGRAPVQLSVPPFRAVIVTTRASDLPGGVGIVWPPGSGVKVEEMMPLSAMTMAMGTEQGQS
jgi:hypothetical protein